MKLRIFVALLAFQLAAISLAAQTTSFTFQGKLTDTSMDANGPYDFVFKLYDSLANGTQVGGDITVNDLNVSAGIFTTNLDFGPAAFSSGSARFIEINVRSGASTGAYTELTPRQRVTSTPYAVKSLSADTATNATTATNSTQLGSVAASQYVQTTDPRMTDARTPTAGSANYIQNTTTQQAANFNINGNGSIGGNLGVGTANPTGNLHVNVPGSGNPISALTVDVGTFGTGTNSVNSYFFKARDLGLGGTPAFLIRGDGNVGINTATPTERLDVSGNIKFSGTITGDGSGLTNVASAQTKTNLRNEYLCGELQPQHRHKGRAGRSDSQHISRRD